MAASSRGRPGGHAGTGGTTLRRWAGLLATALLVVSAGCSGLPGADTTRSRTVTPAPVPSGGSAATARLAPGLSADGVENETALAAAHARSLAGQSYTAVLTSTVRYANGTLRTQTRSRLELSAGRTRYRYAADSVVRRAGRTQSVTRVDAWRSRNRTVRRVQSNGAVCHFSDGTLHGAHVLGAGVDPDGRAAVERLFAVTDPTITSSTRRNRRALYRLQWTGSADPGVAGPRRLVALTAVVDDRGFVNWYRATYRLTRDRTTVTIVRDVRFVDVGDTAVSQPGWVETAPDADGCVPSDRDARG